ncbi:Ran-binding protein 9 [Larimichthys crocea]|uniref:Uncharacterized protein n=1 Tax=Larimichthys crocea TaxID=215358 RepID=A0ACD3QTD3_LARCR|nr:Ran-binding protein 9 [Larimichthys crocea]
MSGQSSGCGFLMSVVVHGDSALNEQEKELNQRLRRLYPAVNESETPLPRSWSPKDKFSYIGLSQNNLRVHYKGHGKTPKDAASVRATHPIPAACGVYYFEVKIISKGRDGYMGIGLSAQGVNMNRLPGIAFTDLPVIDSTVICSCTIKDEDVLKLQMKNRFKILAGQTSRLEEPGFDSNCCNGVTSNKSHSSSPHSHKPCPPGSGSTLPASDISLNGSRSQQPITSSDVDMEVDHFTNGVTESSSNGFLNGSSKHTTEPDDCDADMALGGCVCIIVTDGGGRQPRVADLKIPGEPNSCGLAADTQIPPYIRGEEGNKPGRTD